MRGTKKKERFEHAAQSACHCFSSTKAAAQLCVGGVPLTLFDGEQHGVRDALVGPRQKQIDVHRSLSHNIQAKKKKKKKGTEHIG